MVTQFTQLERRTVRGSNHESIDHPKGLHDDVSNAVAGVIFLIADRKHQPMRIAESVLRRIDEPIWWPGSGRETAADRWQRAEREARAMKTINLDDGSDEPLPSVPILSSSGGR